METDIKQTRKQKAKDQLKVIQKFESLADSFDSTSSMERMKATGERAGMAIKKETAGDLKRATKEKHKKEKTLGAKLRLKNKGKGK